MTRIQKTLVVLACVASLLAAMCAVSYSGRLEVRELAFEAMDNFHKDGYHIREEIQLGSLLKGESYYFDTQLSAGNEYFFFSAGDANIFAMELMIYDENWQLVAADNAREPAAQIIYTPEWSGVFHVKLTMSDAGPDDAYWFIVSGYR